MTIILYRQSEPADPREVGRFKTEGDALWAATVFQSHKVFGKHNHWVEVRKGRKVRVLYPAAALDARTFNLIQEGNRDGR